MIDIQKPFNIANITIHPTTDKMSCDGVTIEVKSMAMKIICFFAVHPDQVVTRDTLRTNIWQNANASDHTINNHIYSVRRIFATFDSQTKFFHTVTGSKSGYRLLAPVTQLASEQLHSQSDSTGTAESRASNVQPLPEQPETPSTSSLLNQIKKFKKTIVLLMITMMFLVIFIRPTTVTYNNVSPLTTMSGREQNPSISNDGSILLFANRTNRESTWELYASRLSDNSTILTTKKVFSDDARNENYVSISPDNKHIAFIRYPDHQRGIYLADFDENTLSASNEHLIIPLKTMNLSPIISWLSNDQFFYTATHAISAPRKIYKYDVKNSQSEPITAPPLNTYGDFSVVVSPNKKWLAIMRSDEQYGYQLFLYDLRKKVLVPTTVINKKERLNVSFSDNSQAVYFIDDNDYLAKYSINNQQIKVISSQKLTGYWPLKIPRENQFIIQQDWGLSSLTNRIIKISNPRTGGDGSTQTIVDNNMSSRSITGIGGSDLIFAAIGANQQVELWKYHQGKSVKLSQFNNFPQYRAYLSLDWLKHSNNALLSINDTCFLIDINTGKDSPLCPANEKLYAGKFSKDGQSIYLINTVNDSSRVVNMGISGYPVTPLNNIPSANSIQQDAIGNFYYSDEPSFDIYRVDGKTGKHSKIIDRTFVIERFSNNDFVVTQSGIYFMDRKKIRHNAVYYYNFSDKRIQFVVASKDNYPHIVVSDDEKYITLIESYDNDSRLSLIDAN